MPEVRDTVEVAVDVSVYCNTCGNGLCGSATIKHDSDLYVDVCPKCEKYYTDTITDLEETIEDLKRQLKERDK